MCLTFILKFISTPVSSLFLSPVLHTFPFIGVLKMFCSYGVQHQGPYRWLIPCFLTSRLILLKHSHHPLSLCVCVFVCAHQVRLQGSQIRLACYEALVRTDIWPKCCAAALSRISESDAKERKIERRQTGTSQLGQQWHAHGCYAAALEKVFLCLTFFPSCLSFSFQSLYYTTLPWCYLNLRGAFNFSYSIFLFYPSLFL